MRYLRNGSCALLCLISFTKRAATAGDPAERMRALIVCDEKSAKLSPEHWPDLSPEALREREAPDRTTLDKLHAVMRKDLAVGDRTVDDLFEWSLNRRLEQLRLRLYLTPFWSDDRYVRFAGLLGPRLRSRRTLEERSNLFLLTMRQAVALLRERIGARMLPSEDLVRLVSVGCSASSSGANPEDPWANKARNFGDG